MCNRLREKNSANVGGVIVIGLDEMENGNLEGTRKKQTLGLLLPIADIINVAYEVLIEHFNVRMRKSW